MTKELICIVCPQGCHLRVESAADGYHVAGGKCKRGIAYAVDEMTAPKRTLTSTVEIKGAGYARLPVKTSVEVPQELLFDCMKEIDKISVEAPVKEWDILLADILGTGSDIIAARSMKRLDT